VTEGGATTTGTATVLFTDLVDSTELWTEAGDGADELRRTHDRLLAEAVTASNGTVVKSLGDGIMATFPAAADAVSAAVAIQQATDGHNRRSASSALVVRVGVSVGDVTLAVARDIGQRTVERRAAALLDAL
jgi:class 3 adenylate cyclase